MASSTSSGNGKNSGTIGINNSSRGGGRHNKRFQKLRGTFGEGLNEKLLPFQSIKCVEFSSSDGLGGGGGRRALDVFDEEEEENENSLEESSDRKDSGVDMPEQKSKFSKSSSRRSLHSNSSGNVTRIHESYEMDEELSAGFPSDLPSGLVDIEGNIIGEFDIRFGLEDDDLSSIDEHSYSTSARDYRTKNNCKKNKKSNRDALPILSSSKSRCISPRSKSPRAITPEMPNALGLDTLNTNCLRRESESGNDTLKLNHNNNPTNYYTPSSNSNGSASGSGPTYREVCPGDNNKARAYPHRRRSRSPHAALDRHYSSGATSSNSSTITQHYYPEGGWGYVILVTSTSCHTLLCGMQLSFGILMNPIFSKFGEDLAYPAGWLGALSLGISLFLSPVWVSICKRKSTRLSAVFGGLVASLGCLFTSFASQFHQLFVSYGAFLGIGVGLTRDASTLMVGQYFKRKRELVEIFVVSGSGIGIVLMSVSIHGAISSLGWRLGLQAITGSLFLTFFLSTCYRSASLYHPQRRAILHLKNQKRKVKEKEKREEKPPFIDYSCLRSKTLQILLLSSAFTSFGMYNPLFALALECTKKGFEGCSLVLLHVYVGTAWIIGSCLFGLLVIQKSQDCRVSKQYLAQVASVICGISTLALTAVKGNSGMVIFAWVYGFSLGGYNYALKVYTYERVRARHFPRAWSFVQSVQALPLLFGVPLSGHINQLVGWKYGYYFSALSVFIGAGCLFLTDVRRRRMSRRKASQNSSMKTCETTDGTQSPKSKRLSFSFPIEQQQPQSKHDSDDEEEPRGGLDPSVMLKELTCISEEMADIDFGDIYFDEWAEYFGECITSCNKVENCLASEYDPDYAVLVERRARRWSAARQSLGQNGQNQTASGKMLQIQNPSGSRKIKGKATTVLGGIPMINPRLFHLNLGNRSQNPNQTQNQNQPSSDEPLASGSSRGPPTNTMRAVPFLRSHITKGRGPLGTIGPEGHASLMPPIRTFSVIDEDSV